MTCTCAPQWPALTAPIDGHHRPAEPAQTTPSAAAAATTRPPACVECGATYPGQWALTATVDGALVTDPDTAAEASKASPTPGSAVEMLRRIVAQRANGEVRPQQEQMVGLVEQAIKTNQHLLVQAGTGTGKSLGYLIPAVASGKRVVVSTATKQLSEQIVNVDMPILADLIPQVGGPEFSYALLKGRNNFACLREIDSLNRLEDEAEARGGADTEHIQEALFGGAPLDTGGGPRRPSADDLAKLNALLKWADETTTGDRSHAPAVPDRVWNQVSTDSAGCVGKKSCPFGEDCFAEHARAEARIADVVVTNHAQVAQDLISEGESLLGDYQVLVTDEVHELESYLSSAWGVEVAPGSMTYHFNQAAKRLPKGDRYTQGHDAIDAVTDHFEGLVGVLNGTDEGLMYTIPDNVGAQLVALATSMRTVHDALALSASEQGISDEQGAERKGAAGKIHEMVLAVAAVCEDITDGTKVRWLEAARGTRGPVLKVAPLWIGPKLMHHLGERALIATSATMTIGGKFDSFARTLALNEPITNPETGEVKPARAFSAVDVGTPFDYEKQAMLFIPDTTFPAPVGSADQRQAHSEACRDLLVDFVAAAGGRTLALFTTRRGAEEAAAHLRLKTNYPVLCQGDAPPSQLIEQFKEDQATVLCATMGFWHGIDISGDACISVVLDKAPFAPMFDPLLSARRKAADDAGRSGFDEVFVAGASVMLAQGVGRLIRTATDRGVIAVLDNRLMTKGYGRTMIGSMPKMRIFRDKDIVIGALSRLADAADGEHPEKEGAATGGSAPSAEIARVRQRAQRAVAGQAAAAGGGAPPRRAAPSARSTRALGKTNKPA